MHPVLQPREIRRPGGAERHDLAVDDHGLRPEPGRGGDDLGIPVGDVGTAAGEQHHPAPVPRTECAHPVPLHLRPRRLLPAVRGRAGDSDVGGPGEHRAGSRGRRSRGRRSRGRRSGVRVGCLLLHPVYQPRGFLAGAGGADQSQAHAVERAARATVHRDDDLVVAPFLRLVPAPVPDRDRAGAVFAPRDLALERGVLQRMILRLDREMIDGRRIRDALRHGPADEHPVTLQPEVVVQPPSAMLLHHETRVLSVLGSRRSVTPVGHRFRGARGRALAPVRPERVIRRPVGAGGQHIREEVARLDDTAQHLLELQLRQIRIGQLVPPAGCGHGRPEPPAERIRRDRRLVRVVLAPVHEHATGSQ